MQASYASKGKLLSSERGWGCKYEWMTAFPGFLTCFQIVFIGFRRGSQIPISKNKDTSFGETCTTFYCHFLYLIVFCTAGAKMSCRWDKIYTCRTCSFHPLILMEIMGKLVDSRFVFYVQIIGARYDITSLGTWPSRQHREITSACRPRLFTSALSSSLQPCTHIIYRTH